MCLQGARATRLTETRLQQREQREHPAGFSFFGTVGIIEIEMTSGADAVVVNLRNACGSTLANNFGREIDFVMRRTYARAELHDKVGRIRSEMRFHLRDGIRDHAEFRASFSRVHEANRRFFSVDNVNRAAVGHVNTKRDFSLLCDEAIATAELLIGSPRYIDNRNLAAVNLRGSHDREIGHADCTANFAMRRVQAR